MRSLRKNRPGRGELFRSDSFALRQVVTMSSNPRDSQPSQKVINCSYAELLVRLQIDNGGRGWNQHYELYRRHSAAQVSYCGTRSLRRLGQDKATPSNQLEFELPLNQVERFLNELSDIRRPILVAESLAGCDGTWYEVEFGSSQSCTFRWWDISFPPEWNELVEIVNRLLDFWEAERKRHSKESAPE